MGFMQDEFYRKFERSLHPEDVLVEVLKKYSMEPMVVALIVKDWMLGYKEYLTKKGV